MKKAILISVIFLAGTKLLAQTDEEVFTEEKSSEWLKIAVAPAPVNRPVSRANRRTASGKPASDQKLSAPKPAEVFKKTNREVKRFKKKEQ